MATATFGILVWRLVTTAGDGVTCCLESFPFSTAAVLWFLGSYQCGACYSKWETCPWSSRHHRLVCCHKSSRKPVSSEETMARSKSTRCRGPICQNQAALREGLGRKLARLRCWPTTPPHKWRVVGRLPNGHGAERGDYRRHIDCAAGLLHLDASGRPVGRLPRGKRAGHTDAGRHRRRAAGLPDGPGPGRLHNQPNHLGAGGVPLGRRRPHRSRAAQLLHHRTGGRPPCGQARRHGGPCAFRTMEGPTRWWPP